MRLSRIPYSLLAIILALSFFTGCQPSVAPQLPSSPTSQLLPSPLPQLPDPAAPHLTPSPVPSHPITPTPQLSPSPTPPLPTSPPSPITLLFTGVIVPARCVQAAIDARGNPDYPYEEVREMISKADLAIGTLNATISDISPHKGCVRTPVLVGSASNADALGRAGFDLMSVATNHLKDCSLGYCGEQAFADTLANLRRVGIQPVGAGQHLAEAIQPVVATVNGIRFGIVSLGNINPLVFATEDTPGIAVLNEENLKASIRAARAISDVVIVMPHWGLEDDAYPLPQQRKLAQIAIEAGADLVVGNHTHVIQAIESLDGVMVFYGLGNFVFDQTWSIDHQQGVILQVSFDGTQMVGYELIPTHVDADGRVHLAAAAEADEILQRIERISDDWQQR